MAQKLNSQYQQFYSQLDAQRRLQLHQSYVAWLSYRNQLCLLLNSRNIIQYNYCATKLSLDVIFDMQHYLNK
ncbi:lysozyme inhibitor LprI family protein [Wohlfahrtiimonas populi]|uniref:lysozyme inhibitor LprI family protein n=1 Tax=Wohlfahrtiimonas populi TaxID=1940240 RepID=UPI0038CD4667